MKFENRRWNLHTTEVDVKRLETLHDTYPCSSSWRVRQQSDWLETANRRLRPTISSNFQSSWFWSVWRLRPCFADSPRVYPGVAFTEKKSSFTFFSFFKWRLITLIWLLLLGCTKTDDRLRLRCLWYLVSLSPNAISSVSQKQEYFREERQLCQRKTDIAEVLSTMFFLHL